MELKILQHDALAPLPLGSAMQHPLVSSSSVLQMPQHSAQRLSGEPKCSTLLRSSKMTAAGMRSEDLDEEERARTSGRGNATSDDERGGGGGGGGTTEEEEEDEQDLFNEALDPLSLLDGMHEVLQAGGAGQQPYEVLAARKRAARREQAHADIEVRPQGLCCCRTSDSKNC